MKSLIALSLVMLSIVACGGGGSPEPTVPILSANGTISINGREVVPGYAVAGSGENSKSVVVVLSDAPTGCSILADDYLRNHILPAGTYVFVALPSFDKGVAERNMVDYTVASQGGSFNGTGSDIGKVEVLDATDAAVTIRVEYRDSLSFGECVMSGDFSATRCPLPTQ